MKSFTEDSVDRLERLDRAELRDAASARSRRRLGWVAIAAVGFALLAARAHGYAPALEQLPSTSIPAAGGEQLGDDALLKAGLAVVKAFGGAVAAGEAFVACVLACVLLVILLRLFGKRIHDAIPDDSWADKPFFFLFDTKPGGVLLNAATSAALSVVAMLGAGVRLEPSTLPAVILGAGGIVGFASALYGWGKDLWDWWKKKKVAEATVAGAVAAAKVDDTKKAVDEINKL